MRRDLCTAALILWLVLPLIGCHEPPEMAVPPESPLVTWMRTNMLINPYGDVERTSLWTKYVEENVIGYWRLSDYPSEAECLVAALRGNARVFQSDKSLAGSAPSLYECFPRGYDPTSIFADRRLP